MTSQQTVTSETPKRQLEKSSVDFASTKTQMLIGALFIACSSAIAFESTLIIGLLGSETLALTSIASALSGSFTLLQNNLQSLCLIDYFVFHSNCIGYHCVNILLTIVCSIFVSLITLELTGRMGNRHGAITAVWAGLLFSVYPLHAQVLAPIMGRQEILASMFYLVSLFLFLRYRLIGENKFYVLSLAFAAVALLCQAHCCTLAAVITMLAMHPAVPPFAKNTLLDAIKCSAPFWLFSFAAYFLWPHNLLSAFAQIDKNTFLQVLIPVNQIDTSKNILIALVPLGASLIVLLLKLSSPVAGEPPAARNTKRAINSSPTDSVVLCAILLTWLVSTILFSVNNHSFLSAAPLSILIAICALEAGNATRKRAKIVFVGGLTAVVSLYLSWSYLLTLNLKPYIEASKVVASYRKQAMVLKTMHKKLLLANLPAARGPVMPIGSLENLKRLLAPPFCQADLSQDLFLLSGDGHYNPSLLQANKQIYLWLNGDQKMVELPVINTRDRAPLLVNFSDASWLKGSGWQVGAGNQWQNVSRAKPFISIYNSLASLRTFDQPAILWLPFKVQSPASDTDLWFLRLLINREDAAQIKVVARNYTTTEADPNSKFDSVGADKESQSGAESAYDLTGLPNYMLSTEPQQIGLKLAANQKVSMRRIELAGPYSSPDINTSETKKQSLEQTNERR